jgi:hypothetical protein
MLYSSPLFYSILLCGIFFHNLKWKLRGSFESQLCWMVFCWGQTHEGVFSWSRHRWKAKADSWRNISLKQTQEKGCSANCKHVKGHVIKDTLLITCKHWSALPCIAEHHRLGLHREKCTKKFLVVCCSFLPLPRNQADCQSNVSWCRLTWWGKTHGGHMIFRGSINRTRRTVVEAELGLLIGLAAKHLWVSCMLVSRLHWSLLHWEEQLKTFPGVPVVPVLPFVLTRAEAEAWLSLLGRVPLMIRVCYPHSTKEDCWYICEVFASGSRCHCWPQWTELLISRQHRQELLQRTFLNRSTSPVSFLFHYLWWVVATREKKHLRTIIKNRVWKKLKLKLSSFLVLKKCL